MSKKKGRVGFTLDRTTNVPFHRSLLANGAKNWNGSTAQLHLVQSTANRLDWPVAKVLPLFVNSVQKAGFDPDEPRDWHGRWTTGGDEADPLVGDGPVTDSTPAEWVSGDSNYTSLDSMPSNIEGIPITKAELPGVMVAKGSVKGITVNTSARMSEVWNHMARHIKNAYEAGWFSSPNPNHAIWHELGHVLAKRSMTATQDAAVRNITSANNPEFKLIADKVSRYASTNGHEFIGEVFAGMRAGRKFDADVMRYYDKLGGRK